MDAYAAIEDLATGALGTDEAKARSLFNLASPVLECRARRRCLSKAVWDKNLQNEIAQTALVRVWRYRGTFRGSSARELFGWFQMICNNVIADVLSSRSRLRAFREDAELAEQLPAPTEWKPLRSEEKDAVALALITLSEEDPDAYDVVSLIHFAAATEREVAEILQRPRATVNAQKRRAYLKLSEHLRDRGHRGAT